MRHHPHPEPGERRARARQAVLQRLHDDQAGQISMLVVLGAVALVGLLGMVMTTGDQVSQKIRMQNAADAAALSGGVWIARGLNITSGFNLVQTQLAAGTVLLRGMNSALPRIASRVARQNAFYSTCAWYSSFCSYVVGVTSIQLGILSGFQPVIAQMTAVLASCPAGLFPLVARVLAEINRMVHSTFYWIAAAEALDVARVSGAERAVLVPGPALHGANGWVLPTRQRPFGHHCDAMEHGSRWRLHRGFHPLVGYEVGDGPYALGRNRLRWIVRGLGGAFFTWTWWRSLATYNRETSRQKDSACSRGLCGDQHPALYVLDSSNDGLSYLAVAYRPNRQIFFTGDSVASPPDFYTYAQVEIYNGVNGPSPDTYTQDWRVRLAPASLIERPVAGSIFSGFGLPIDGVLGGGASSGGALRQVANH